MADEFKSEKPAKIRKYATGERHGRHLLTAAQVVANRRRLMAGDLENLPGGAEHPANREGTPF